MTFSTASKLWRSGFTGFRRVLGPVWHNLGALIGLEIVFNTLVFVLVGPVVAALSTRLIATHGTVAVSNFEIATFLLTPAGVILLAVTGLAAVLGLYVHLGSIALVTIGAVTERRVTMLGAFLATLRRSPQLVGVAAIELLAGALAIIPLAGLGALAFQRLMTGHDIYFYLSVRPPAFWAMVVIGVILGVAGAAILLGLSVRWFFTTLVVLVEGRRPLAALRRSAELVRPIRRRIVATVLSWIVTIAVLTLVFSVALWLLDRLGFAIAGRSTGRLVVVIGALIALRVAAGLIVGFFAQNSLGIAVAYLYLERARPDDLGVPAGPAWITRMNQRPRRTGLILTAAATVLAGLTVWVCFQISDKIQIDQHTMIAAHRGSSLRAPENTLAAIRAAIEDGADVVEIDVQETADGQIIVLHDKDLTRVTGVRRNVWEVTLDEIRALEAGRWFAPEFDGEPIPTLTECIDVCRGRIKLLIELKYNGHDVALADRVLDIVEAEGVTDECLFMSLEMRGVTEIEQRRPDTQCGLVVGSSIGNIAGLDVDFVAIGQGHLDRLTYDALLTADTQIWVWTVNDRAGMVRFLARDIEGLITDEPAGAFEIRNELDELEAPERMILAFRYRLPF